MYGELSNEQGISEERSCQRTHVRFYLKNKIRKKKKKKDFVNLLNWMLVVLNYIIAPDKRGYEEIIFVTIFAPFSAHCFSKKNVISLPSAVGGYFHLP